MPFSREKTFDSIYYSFIRTKFNVYYELFFDGTVVISKYVNGNCIANWEGTVKESKHIMNKYFNHGKKSS
jgi:hypothetical protein